MQYTLATLKAAVVDAAIASDKQGFESVKDRKSVIKAVRKKWPNDKNDARTYAYWLGLATYFGIDNQPWKDARASKSTGTKLKDLKASIYNHYQVADTKSLKKKLIDWGIPYTNLRYKQSWQKLWDEVQPHYQAVA